MFPKVIQNQILTISTSLVISIQFAVVEFLLRDHHYSNNEIVPLTEVGEKSDALLCLTNSTKIESSMMGEWYFPDSSRVPLNGLDSGIYSTRGPSAVSLNRKNDTMMPTGVYRCVVPDANESNQSIYIGVYSSKEGDGNNCACSK